MIALFVGILLHFSWWYSFFPRPQSDPQWHPSTVNLAMGFCFTHQEPGRREYSQATSDFVILDMENPFLASGYSLFAFVHNEGMFLPSYGMSSEFAGQRGLTIT